MNFFSEFISLHYHLFLVLYIVVATLVAYFVSKTYPKASVFIWLKLGLKFCTVFTLGVVPLVSPYLGNLTSYVSFAPIFLVLHCLFIFLFKRWLGPVGTFYASILSLFTVFIFSINELYYLLLTGVYSFVDFGRWFFCLDLIDSHLVFCIDSLALVASILVTFLTMFALHFGVEYMYREAFINRLLYLLNLFATSVVFLFYCYDYFLILFSWECIGLFSFLLVNFYSSRIYTIKAALKTFVFSRISDMFMFLSFLLVINTFMSTDLSLIFLQVPFLSFHYIFIGPWLRPPPLGLPVVDG